MVTNRALEVSIWDEVKLWSFQRKKCFIWEFSLVWLVIFAGRIFPLGTLSFSQSRSIMGRMGVKRVDWLTLLCAVPRMTRFHKPGVAFFTVRPAGARLVSLELGCAYVWTIMGFAGAEWLVARSQADEMFHLTVLCCCVPSLGGPSSPSFLFRRGWELLHYLEGWAVLGHVFSVWGNCCTLMLCWLSKCWWWCLRPGWLADFL